MPPRLPLPFPLAGPSRLPSRALRVRHASSSSPSPKIVAAPFRISPADALHKLQMNGLVASANFSNMIYAGLLRFFGPGIGTFAKEFGLGESLTLRGLKAVYWPVWRFDLILEGTAETGAGKTSKGSLGVAEGYIPGNSFAPLSYLSYSVPPLPHDLPTYDPSKDLQQLGDGYEVVPVPWTVSPFAVGERIRKLVGKRATWDGVRIDEAKWIETMFACYPIMFPMYIADFEFKTEARGRRFAVVLDAHDENEMIESKRFTKNYYINPAPFLPSLQLILPMASARTAEVPPTVGSLNDIYSNWLSPPPVSASAIPPSPLLKVSEDTPEIRWDDVRIQSWSGETFEENNEYFDKAMETHKSLGALESIADFSSQLPKGADPQGVVISGESKLSPKPMSEIKAQLSEDVDRLKEELEGVKPKWLKEYDETKALPERLQAEPMKKA